MSVRIAGLEVESFGVLSGMVLDDVPPGLTVVTGGNEAGKSTLLRFIRFVLFGAPPSGAAAPAMPDRAGGSLHLVTDRGPVRLRRFGPGAGQVEVELPDGRAGGPEDLAAVVGHATAGLFHRVFAFDLAELEGLAALDDEALVHQMFAAGVAGGGARARDALRRVRQAADRQLTAAGREGQLLALAREMARQRAVLRDAEARALRHRELLLAGQEALARGQERDAEIGRLTAAQAHLNRLVALWPVAIDLRQARAARAALGDLPDPGPQAAERYRRCRDRAVAAEAALDRRAEELADLERRAAGHAADAALAAVAPQAQDLAGRSAWAKDASVRLEALSQQAAAAAAERREALDRLGGDWQPAEIAAVDTSDASREALEGAADRARQLRAQLEQARRRQAERRAEAAERQREADALRREFTALGPLARDADLAARREGIRAVRDALAALEEAERQAEGILGPRGRAAIAIGQRAMAALIGALLLALVGGAAAISGRVNLGLGLGGISILALAWLALRRPDTASQAARTAAMQARLRLGREALALGLSERPAEADLTRLEEQLAADLQTAERARDLSARVRHAREEHARAESAAREADLETRDLERDSAAADEALAVLAAPLRLPDPRQAEACVPQLLRLERAQRALVTAEETERQRASLAREVAAYAEAAREVLGAAGRPPLEDTPAVSLADAVSRLAEDAAEALRLSGRRQELERLLAEAGPRLLSARREHEAAQEELSALFDRVGVADPDAFADLLDRVGRAAELDRTIAALERQLAEQLGDDENGRARRAELEGGARERWTAELESYAARLDEARQERDAALRAAAEAEAARRDLETSADAARAGLAVAQLEEQARRALAEHHRLRLAERLVRESLEEFEQTHQPTVLRGASARLAVLTRGRHVAVRRAEGGVLSEDLSVVGQDGGLRGVTELSAGTQQQLYLALRLGLADQFAERATSLPLVLDDILVNFDPERAAAAAQVLAEAAQRHQVLYFTCHPALADLLASAAGARPIDLDALTGTARLATATV